MSPPTCGWVPNLEGMRDAWPADEPACQRGTARRPGRPIRERGSTRRSRYGLTSSASCRVPQLWIVLRRTGDGGEERLGEDALLHVAGNARSLAPMPC